MKNYESPVIYDNEELAEGVYATGSGGGGATCWSVKINGSQDNAGIDGVSGCTYSVTEVAASHHTDIVHDSIGLTFEGDIQINTEGDSVKRIWAEQTDGVTYEFTFIEGSTHFFVTRNRYADAFHSGDEVTFKIMVASSSPDIQNPPKVINVYNPVCNSQANWEGGEGGT